MLALLLVTSCETRRERSRGEMSKHRVKNLPPADSLQPAVCSNPVYCTPYDSMPWDITVAAHERMVGAAMKQAFGNDLGTIWGHLHRKYVLELHFHTGEKVGNLVDVTESIKSVSSDLITTNIEDQFRGDPTALDHNRRAVDTASFNAMRYIKCHPEQFPSFHTSLKQWMIRFDSSVVLRELEVVETKTKNPVKQFHNRPPLLELMRDPGSNSSLTNFRLR